MKVNHCNGLESVLVDYKNETYKYYDDVDNEEIIDADIEVWLKNSMALTGLIKDLQARGFKKL